MITTADTLIEHGLTLPAEQRRWVAQRLFDSIDEDETIDPEYEKEILSRIEEVKSGTAVCIPGEVVLAELKQMCGAK